MRKIFYFPTKRAIRNCYGLGATDIALNGEDNSSEAILAAGEDTAEAISAAGKDVVDC